MSEATPDNPGDQAVRVRNWTLETDHRDIAWLGLRGEGSTNVLSRQVLLELDTVLAAFEQAPPSSLIIFSHKSSGFIAGADVHQFPEMQDEANAYEQIRGGQKVIERLAALPFTTVAVLNGVTLGGGLELALACNWRISYDSDRSTIGLPEVQLGVHPGLGGTIRSVDLAGVRNAMQLMLTGKPVRPAKAKAMGLVDRLTTEEGWRADAIELATRRRPPGKPGLLDRVLCWKIARPLLARMLRKQVSAKARPEHYPAPFAIIDLWRESYGSANALDAEARSFAKLVFSQTSRNLVRVFFLQDRLKSFAKQTDIQFGHAHVVGAGTMGADIAAWCAIRGMSVTLQDREKRFIDTGMDRAHESMRKKLKTDERIAEARKRLVADLTGEGARTADIVIEAIFENLEAKQQLFRDIEERARPDALLATNTSSIPLKQIASALASPPRLVGLHFFNPVALMPLVEVVHSPTTLHAAADAGAAFVRQIGKLPLPCKGMPGFLVNRILAPYMDEAFRLREEGFEPETIDRAAVDFGMPVGPLELADSVGLDILVHVAEIVADTIGRDLPPGLEAMVEQGKLGRKTGEGFYRWEDGKAVRNKSAPKDYPPAIGRRLVLSLVNEAAACIADRVVADADLADAGTIFGAGFAPFRGGPIQYARETGLEAIVAELEQLQKSAGDRFRPSEGWKMLLKQESQA